MSDGSFSATFEVMDHTGLNAAVMPEGADADSWQLAINDATKQIGAMGPDKPGPYEVTLSGSVGNFNADVVSKGAETVAQAERLKTSDSGTDIEKPPLEVQPQHHAGVLDEKAAAEAERAGATLGKQEGSSTSSSSKSSSSKEEKT